MLIRKQREKARKRTKIFSRRQSPKKRGTDRLGGVKLFLDREKKRQEKGGKGKRKGKG